VTAPERRREVGGGVEPCTVPTLAFHTNHRGIAQPETDVLTALGSSRTPLALAMPSADPSERPLLR